MQIFIDNDEDGILDAADDIEIDDDFNSGAMSLTYDSEADQGGRANGNLTGDGIFKYVYDAWNRLVKVTRRVDAETTVAQYEYDPNGTNNGRIVERYTYTPYGQFIVLTGDTGSAELGNVLPTSTVGNVFTHQGLPFDHENSIYQNRRRGYLPGLQRFAQADPLMRQNHLTKPRSGQAHRALHQQLPQHTLLETSQGLDHRRCAGCTYARVGPPGYGDGLSAYRYERSNPSTKLDPRGLQCDPPDGCSWSPDRPCGYDFTNACNTHDLCYCTCGRSRSQCDTWFCGDLHWTCRYYYHDAFLCHRLADIYCAAVRLAGEGAFCDAQRAEGCAPLPPECQ